MLRSATPLVAALIALAPSHCPAPSGDTVEIHLEGGTVELRPSRDDLEVAALWLQVRCLRQATAAERAASGFSYATCDGFTVDGTHREYGTLIELPAQARNRVRFEPLDLAFATDRGGHLCLALRAIFAGVSPRNDQPLYRRPADRYSLLSYCTVEEQPEWVDGRHTFEQNRVSTLAELRHALARPLAVDLVPPGAPGQERNLQ
ncbi:MAG TPA: hypothetical protein VKU40_14585 [Thermoanaerobaculia bacterium]|nr:hypothetical protein [Thermoanaerobaculia bacterium]